MIHQLAEWLWTFQRHCPPAFDPEPHWGRILSAWRWGLEPSEVASMLTQGRLSDLEARTQRTTTP